MYTELKRKPAFPAEYRDINKFKTLEEFDDVIDRYSNITSKKERFRLSRDTGIKLLEDSHPYKLYVVTTAEAAAKHFRGEDWCVKDPAYFNSNTYDPPIFYYFTKNDNPYTLIHLDHEECHDRSNHPVSLNDEQIEMMTSENVKEDIESRNFSRGALAFYDKITENVDAAIEEIKRQLDNIRERYLDGDHVYADYYIYDEVSRVSDISFTFDSGLTIQLDEAFETNDTFPNNAEDYDFKTNEQLKKFITYIKEDYFINEHADWILKINQLTNYDANKIVFQYRDDRSYNDVDDFKDCIDEVNKVGEHYLQIKKIVQLALAHAGFVKGEQVDEYVQKFQTIENSDEFIENLKHLNFDFEDSTIDIRFPNIKIRAKDNYAEVNTEKLSELMGVFITNYLKSNYEPMNFSNIQEHSVTFHDSDLESFGIHTITTSFYNGYDNQVVNMHLWVGALNSDTANLVKFLDHYYQDLHHAVELAVYKTVKDSNQFYIDKGYFNRLDHVYSKYMKENQNRNIQI
jgi:hypothetical protein